MHKSVRGYLLLLVRQEYCTLERGIKIKHKKIKHSQAIDPGAQIGGDQHDRSSPLLFDLFLYAICMLTDVVAYAQGALHSQACLDAGSKSVANRSGKMAMRPMAWQCVETDLFDQAKFF